MKINWKCQRCNAMVDMGTFRCQCTESPSPWEPVSNMVDDEYFRLLNLVLKSGRVKKNRTGVDTIGIFGAQAKFDVSLDAFPILTTKKVWFKGIVHELLWFLKGDTNIKYLVDNDVHIWDEWAYKRHCFENPTDETRGYTQEGFIRKIKEDPSFAKKYGELGEGTYGGMWRAFPYWSNTRKLHVGNSEIDTLDLNNVDQISKVIEKLKTNPDDRRMIVSAWHPYWVDHCALPPCHCLFHFNTEELTLEERAQLYCDKYCPEKGVGIMPPSPMEIEFDKLNIPKRRLNLLLYQRSCDSGLGVPYNITSYCLMLCMVSQCVNMLPGIFTHTYGDLHIYVNHIEALKQQLTRTPRCLPKLWLNPEVKDLFSFKYEDIKLIGYDPHPTIKMPVAV